MQSAQQACIEPANILLPSRSMWEKGRRSSLLGSMGWGLHSSLLGITEGREVVGSSSQELTLTFPIHSPCPPRKNKNVSIPLNQGTQTEFGARSQVIFPWFHSACCSKKKTPSPHPERAPREFQGSLSFCHSPLWLWSPRGPSDTASCGGRSPGHLLHVIPEADCRPDIPEV